MEVRKAKDCAADLWGARHDDKKLIEEAKHNTVDVVPRCSAREGKCESEIKLSQNVRIKAPTQPGTRDRTGGLRGGGTVVRRNSGVSRRMRRQLSHHMMIPSD